MTVLVTFCAVINYQAANNRVYLGLQFQREGVYNGREGMETGGRSRKLRDHTFNSKHKAEREQGMGQDYNPIKSALSEGLPSERLLPKHSNTSHSVIKRGPGIQIPK